MKTYDVKNNEEYEIIICDINKINKSWENSDLHISQNTSEIEEKIKYNKSRNDLFNMKVKVPPTIFLNDNNIEFDDGRNRFSNLRDINCQKMPFIIYKKEKDAITKLYC
jgi:hypothetical protein